MVVQVAHLAGAGSAEDEGAQQALEVFANAVAKRDARTRLLYFDVTALGPPLTPEQGRRWAAAIRQIGPERVLFGSDATLPSATPADAWAALRAQLPLTEGEFRTIANNVPPYLR